MKQTDRWGGLIDRHLPRSQTIQSVIKTSGLSCCTSEIMGDFPPDVDLLEPFWYFNTFVWLRSSQEAPDDSSRGTFGHFPEW